ncbi:MAG: hypothetical protein U9N59_12620 [Campylobacterota bacterium]|nr:hypothetical protein [Campylobacterota bacterium]
MKKFKVKYRLSFLSRVNEEIVVARHQSDARKIIESRYPGCKVVACTRV